MAWLSRFKSFISNFDPKTYVPKFFHPWLSRQHFSTTIAGIGLHYDGASNSVSPDYSRPNVSIAGGYRFDDNTFTQSISNAGNYFGARQYLDTEKLGFTYKNASTTLDALVSDPRTKPWVFSGRPKLSVPVHGNSILDTALIQEGRHKITYDRAMQRISYW